MAPVGTLLRMVDMIRRQLTELSPTRSVSLSQCFLSTARAAPCANVVHFPLLEWPWSAL
jgi:hypothetical protein